MRFVSDFDFLYFVQHMTLTVNRPDVRLNAWIHSGVLQVCFSESRTTCCYKWPTIYTAQQHPLVDFHLDVIFHQSICFHKKSPLLADMSSVLLYCWRQTTWAQRHITQGENGVSQLPISIKKNVDNLSNVSYVFTHLFVS